VLGLLISLRRPFRRCFSRFHQHLLQLTRPSGHSLLTGTLTIGKLMGTGNAFVQSNFLTFPWNHVRDHVRKSSSRGNRMGHAILGGMRRGLQAPSLSVTTPRRDSASRVEAKVPRCALGLAALTCRTDRDCHEETL
jgi:hypothetical protein